MLVRESRFGSVKHKKAPKKENLRNLTM
jgi:hypothetical protein